MAFSRKHWDTIVKAATKVWWNLDDKRPVYTIDPSSIERDYRRFREIPTSPPTETEGKMDQKTLKED